MKKSLNLVKQLIEASYEKDRQDRLNDPSKVGKSFFTNYLEVLEKLMQEENEEIQKKGE